jgi:hypothetical protein
MTATRIHLVDIATAMLGEGADSGMGHSLGGTAPEIVRKVKARSRGRARRWRYLRLDAAGEFGQIKIGRHFGLPHNREPVRRHSSL